MFSQDVSRELYDNESPTTTKEAMHTPYHIDAHTTGNAENPCYQPTVNTLHRPKKYHALL